MEYSDKVVIVTGGTKGIGEGCVRAFVNAGSRVVFCARNQDEGDALSKELNAPGKGEAFFVKCDVSKRRGIPRVNRKGNRRVRQVRLPNKKCGRPPAAKADR